MFAQQSFHIHNLPRELLDTLTLRTLLAEQPPPGTGLSENLNNDQAQESNDVTKSSGATGARACNVCLGATFLDVEEQRTHFRSDWHRYNVKTRLGGGQAVSEEKFSHLIEALDDSLSGSASSSSEDESAAENTDAVATLINKTKRLNTHLNPATNGDEENVKKAPQMPITWFHSAQQTTQLGVYRQIFPVYVAENNSYLEELKEMQKGGEEPRTWALFMVAGGHFAGAIVKVGKSREERADEEDAANVTTGKKKKVKKPTPEVEVLRHKTFHRYTTRKKQGGSQSLNDNAKGPAKSAGAQLRRYGEQALREDIQNLLQDWAEDIYACERIWIRASTSNRRIFFDFDGPIIKGDERLRTFPFPTRRPTQSELSRCLLELTRCKVSHFSEEELHLQDEAYLASIKPKPPKPAPAASSQVAQPLAPTKPKLTKEEEQVKDKWLRLLDMITRNRLEALKPFWDREAESLGGVNAMMPEYVESEVTGALKRAGTILQAAAVLGSEEIVRWLLEDNNADPTVVVPLYSAKEEEAQEEKENQEDRENAEEGETVPLKPGSRCTAYDLSKTKVIRDVFRRCAAAHPDKWDWFGAGRVPSGLSKEMEEEREEKKKVRRKGLKDRVKEREREAAAKKAASGPLEPAPSSEPKPFPKQVNLTGPRKLGGTIGSTDAVAGLTPEMKARVEREQRARAAEARLKRLAGNT